MKLQARLRINYIQMMYIHELIMATVQFLTDINIHILYLTYVDESNENLKYFSFFITDDIVC